MIRVGGALAVAVSGLLLLVVTLGGALNALNAWTIVLGFTSGAIALQRTGRPRWAAAVALLVLGMLPALIGGVGLLYGPSLVLLLLGGTQEFAQGIKTRRLAHD